jgi:hypothetical protein
MTRSKNVLLFRADNFIFDRATGETELNYYARVDLRV